MERKQLFHQKALYAMYLLKTFVYLVKYYILFWHGFFAAML